jgi:hypothetical protein
MMSVYHGRNVYDWTHLTFALNYGYCILWTQMSILTRSWTRTGPWGRRSWSAPRLTSSPRGTGARWVRPGTGHTFLI